MGWHFWHFCCWKWHIKQVDSSFWVRVLFILTYLSNQFFTLNPNSKQESLSLVFLPLRNCQQCQVWSTDIYRDLWFEVADILSKIEDSFFFWCCFLNQAIVLQDVHLAHWACPLLQEPLINAAFVELEWEETRLV